MQCNALDLEYVNGMWIGQWNAYSEEFGMQKCADINISDWFCASFSILRSVSVYFQQKSIKTKEKQNYQIDKVQIRGLGRLISFFSFESGTICSDR